MLIILSVEGPHKHSKDKCVCTCVCLCVSSLQPPVFPYGHFLITTTVAPPGCHKLFATQAPEKPLLTRMHAHTLLVIQIIERLLSKNRPVVISVAEPWMHTQHTFIRAHECCISGLVIKIISVCSCNPDLLMMFSLRGRGEEQENRGDGMNPASGGWKEGERERERSCRVSGSHS